MRKLFFLASMWAAGFIAVPAVAIMPPGDIGKAAQGSSAAAQQTGTISKIDLGSRVITINGTTYSFLSTKVRLHNKTNAVSNAQQLKTGMRVGFSATPGVGGAKPHVTDIWLLP